MQQNMMDANVVSQGERAGSSPNSNYDVRNVSNNLIVDKKYAGNHAELRYWFHNMMMTVEEGKGPKPAPAKAGQAPISVGFRSKALGPLCMTDQYVAWDEATGKSVFQTDSVGCPVCCLCKGYVADLNISPDPNDKENSSHIYFATAHDFHTPCKWIPCCCYCCTMQPTLYLLFSCLSCKARGTCACCTCPFFGVLKCTNMCCNHVCCAIRPKV